MSNWSSPAKSTKEKALLREELGILLREEGNYILLEDDNLDWGGASKNTANWSSPSRATSTWASPVKN